MEVSPEVLARVNAWRQDKRQTTYIPLPPFPKLATLLARVYANDSKGF